MSAELRASDDERERTAPLLREHAHAYAARTVAELEELRRDLPAAPAPPGAPSRRRPTRFLLAAFAEIVREGRLRIGRRVLCSVCFRATFGSDRSTVVALVCFGSVDVWRTPAAWADRRRRDVRRALRRGDREDDE